MDNLKFELRALIKFLSKEGRAAEEIYNRLCAMCGESATRLTVQLQSPDG